MKIDINIIANFIEFFGFNLCLCICFCKSLNIYKDLQIYKKVIILFMTILLSFIRSILKNYIPPFIVNIPLIFIYSILLSMLHHVEIQKTLSTFIISLSAKSGIRTEFNFILYTFCIT